MTTTMTVRTWRLAELDEDYGLVTLVTSLRTYPAVERHGDGYRIRIDTSGHPGLRRGDLSRLNVIDVDAIGRIARAPIVELIGGHIDLGDLTTAADVEHTPPTVATGLRDWDAEHATSEGQCPGCPDGHVRPLRTTPVDEVDRCREHYDDAMFAPQVVNARG